MLKEHFINLVNFLFNFTKELLLKIKVKTYAKK